MVTDIVVAAQQIEFHAGLVTEAKGETIPMRVGIYAAFTDGGRRVNCEPRSRPLNRLLLRRMEDMGRVHDPACVEWLIDELTRLARANFIGIGRSLLQSNNAEFALGFV